MKYENIIPYIESGLVSENKHPENSNVRIFNYTPECQFDHKWDEVTLNCRGLIMDITTGEILARPFPKFFNYDEYIQMGGQIPAGELPIVTDKMDGSLGILYELNGKPWIATRGSFTSDQAIWATNWWRENVGMETWGTGVTHLFEIIFNENRIVLKYDFEGLVYLGSIENRSNKTVRGYYFPKIASVEEFPFTSVEELEQLNLDNKEGFVLFYPEANLRVKIKFEEYVRLHKIVTGLSEKGLWELLQEKGLDISPEEVIQDVPDEFFAWMEFIMNNLKTEYREIESQSIEVVNRAREFETRKEQAILIAQRAIHPAVAFAMLDGKDYQGHIFKLIKPKGGKTFTIENESNI